MQQQAIAAVPEPVVPKPMRNLAEVAVPILKVAERKFRDVVVGHARPVYHIAVPTKTPEQLIAKALHAVGELEIRDERHDVEGE